jgi:adenine-specific DNA-methyltransferase
MAIEKLRPAFTFTEDRLAELRAVVPEAFADGAVNWEALREALGAYLEDDGRDTEHFGLTWPGKRQARRLAAQPSKGTLIPAAGEGVEEATTRNLFIEGDNLEVLKLLQKSYAGRVKLIYIDPPYNTGNDFVYNDDYSEPLGEYLRRTGQMDESGQILTSNGRASGRFHSNWMNMIYPRLLLSRQLLTDDGFIFVSIDDNEMHNLRTIMDEIYGSENLMGVLVWKRRLNVDSRARTGLSIDHEYMVVYSKPSAERLRGKEKDLTKYSNPDNDPRGPWASDNLLGLATREQRPNLHYDLINPATSIVYPCPETGWRYSKTTMSQLISEGKILWPANPTGRPRLKRFMNELSDEFTGLSSIIGDDVYSLQGTKELKDLFDGKDIMDFPKPVDYVKLAIQQGTKTHNRDIVLDFFAGSCTTAHAVWQLNREDSGNRRFIMVQLPESTDRKEMGTIAEIGKERLRRASKRMRQEAQSKLDLQNRDTPEDLGFRVYKLGRSNYKAWQDYQGESVEELETFFDRIETPLVDGWQREHVLAEAMLLQGFPLDSTVTGEQGFKRNRIQRVESDAVGHRLFVCLDDQIADETIAQIQLAAEDVFICLDSALTDEAKLRLGDRCTLRVI